MRYGQHTLANQTHPTIAVLGKKQIKNHDGNYVFQVSPEEQFKRFLILGSEKGTYYASERTHTYENAENAVAFIQSNGKRAVELIIEVSEGGRAPKNDPAIFLLALAITHGDAETKALAYQAINRVCRIGTHIFQLCQALRDLKKGWGRGLRRGVSNYYLSKKKDNLAYDILKYRQRDGWTHRDVLRLSHAYSKPLNDVLKYAAGKNKKPKTELIQVFEEAQTATTAKLVKLIKKHNLSWEMLPTEKMKEKAIWEVLLPKMPLTAMIRNLARMTANETLKDKKFKDIVVAKLEDTEAMKKARIHPIHLLTALKTYSSGHGDKGSLSWAPIPLIKDALDDAFEKSFDLVEPSGKRFLLGLDVSGSMEGSTIAGTNLTAREAVACMALVTAKAEKDYHIMGFSGNFINIPLTRKSSFSDAIAVTSNLPFNSTDCAFPMLYASKHKLDIDCFCVYTDNETNSGSVHPFQALKEYRKKSGINAKLVVVGTDANNFSIADPSDAGMLDVVGFDTATPGIISEFAA